MKLYRSESRIEIDGDKGKLTIKRYGRDAKIASFEISSTESTDGSVGTSTITVYNLPKKLKAFVTKKANVRIYAGYLSETGVASTVGLLTEGQVSSITNNTYDSADKSFSFNIKDGADYSGIKEIKVKSTTAVRSASAQKSVTQLISKYKQSQSTKLAKWKKTHPKATSKQLRSYKATLATEMSAYRKRVQQKYTKQKATASKTKKTTSKVKYKPLTFAKGTKASSIIKALAKKAGIKIYGMKLVNDKAYTKGYTASSKPYTAIKSIAKACDTPITRPHGQLYICDPSTKKKTNVYIQESTGMIGQPEKQDDSDDKLTHYQVVVMLRRSLVAGAIFHLKSLSYTGWVIVNSAQWDISDDTFTNTLDVTPYSQYVKKQKKTVADAKKKAAAKKKKLDAAAQKKAKTKQKARSKSKKK